MRRVLVLNAGSSSVKFQLFALPAGGGAAHRLRRGQLSGIGARPRFEVRDGGGAIMLERAPDPAEVAGAAAGLALVIDWIEHDLGGAVPVAVGHRVVHGGPCFDAPLPVDDAVFARLEALVPLAPLHQPHNLAAIAALRRRWPDVPQIACFDTAFHRHHPAVADIFAIPLELHAEGIRRYGFHGLSYEHVAARLREVDPELAAGRAVVAHLGAGCSMCAMIDGRSLASTMSFTALDGLPMATRPGQLDPGVLLYLLLHHGWDGRRLETFLYHECGFLGLSGNSRDLRDILAADTPRARLTVDYFVHRLLAETGSLAAQMGGIDGLVFTGGIGENAAAIRQRVLDGLGWLGFEPDPAANAAGGPRLTAARSQRRAWLIPADEEAVILAHVRALLEKGDGGRAGQARGR